MINKKVNCYLEKFFVSIIMWFIFFIVSMVILSYTNITIKYELSISDFVNIFIAIIISTIIPISIWKIMDNKKSSKDLLLFEINSFLEDLNNLINYINNKHWNSEERIDKNEKINIIFIYITELWNQHEIILENCETYFSSIDLENYIDKYIEFRSTLTDDLRKDDFEFNSFYESQSLKIKLKLQKEIERLKFKIV